MDLKEGIDMALIRTENLIKNFRNGEVEIQVLKGIDIEIDEGEFVAIMGPSGSGKSTLLYLLGGLDQPTEGKVLLDGKDIGCLDDMEISKVRRREMGFIFQFYNLVPVLTVRENILMPIMLDGKKPADYFEKTEELVKMIGLDDRQDHRPSQLSGGQQQRVAIARALVNDPKVILADEPTGNLDSHTSEEILRLMRKLCSEKNKTIIMVTHDPKAAGYADRVIMIRDGLIEEKGCKQPLVRVQ